MYTYMYSTTACAYIGILATLNKHFTPKRCRFADRERFCEAKRATGEKVEEWAARIRGLAVTAILPVN